MTTYNSPFAGNVIQPTDVSYVSYLDLSSDLTLYWPVNGVPEGLSVAARIMDISSTGNGISIIMPPANQVSVGQDALFNNLGSFSITIENASGGTIGVVPSGKSAYFYLTDNGTVAGEWSVVDFGATTSSPNAATLAGYGLLAISNTLNQSYPTSAVINGYTFLAQDRAQSKIWGSGAGTAYLPLAAIIGDNWFFLFKNNGTGTVTLACNGVDLLDNQATKTFQPNESAMIVCTGAGFITVGFGTSNTFFFSALTKNVVNGTYVLTTSEASSIIQEYVGTLTGNVEVVYPPVVAFYVVSNQVVDNGFSLVVTTGIVGSGTATIPPGQQASLICDGVSFFNANTVQAGSTSTSLIDGTVSTPALNFGLETSTGIYRPAAGNLGIAVLGNNIVIVSATGFSVQGSGNFTGGISGGTF